MMKQIHQIIEPSWIAIFVHNMAGNNKFQLYLEICSPSIPKPVKTLWICLTSIKRLHILNIIQNNSLMKPSSKIL